MTHSDQASKNEHAVSPVVGVMLMLVVVIIIAAVVSGFSGGLVSGGSAKKAPTLNMDVKVVNTGDWHGSGFFATVTGVSDSIPTKDIKIVTSWKAYNYGGGTAYSEYTDSGDITGGNTTVPGVQNINTLFNPGVALSGFHAAPFGTGPGVNGTEGVGSLRDLSAPGQQFGNYTLMAGTALSARPAGAADGNSLGSSGQQGSFGGYGASNASYQYIVPGVTYYSYTYVATAASGWGEWECGTSLDGWTEQTCWDILDDEERPNVDHISSTEITTSGTIQWTNEVKGSKYLYTLCTDKDCIDPAKAVLGPKWNLLRMGDTVNVKVIHIPTGKVIFQQDVPVTEE